MNNRDQDYKLTFILTKVELRSAEELHGHPALNSENLQETLHETEPATIVSKVASKDAFVGRPSPIFYYCWSRYFSDPGGIECSLGWEENVTDSPTFMT